MLAISGIQQGHGKAMPCLISSGYHNSMQHMGCLDQQTLKSHGSRGWKSKIRVPAGPAPGENPFLVCRGPPSRCVLTWRREDMVSGVPPWQPHPPGII